MLLITVSTGNCANSDGELQNLIVGHYFSKIGDHKLWRRGLAGMQHLYKVETLNPTRSLRKAGENFIIVTEMIGSGKDGGQHVAIRSQAGVIIIINSTIRVQAGLQRCRRRLLAWCP